MARTEEKQRRPKTPAASANEKKLAEWKAKADYGPHVATLPSGMEVTFVIPNSTKLVRADMLPAQLSEMAIMAASYPDGAEGYLQDLGISAARDTTGAESAKLKDALKQGLELRDWLLSEMMVDPKVTPEQIASGEIPQPDLDMLTAFAERRRNVDSKGVKLPIALAAEYEGFRLEPDSAADAAPVEEGGGSAPEPAGGDDGDGV